MANFYGTATDGTQGLEMIKSEGGITFAQDDSAKYDSMPRSAVAGGCVDLVLSPKEIAKELARIAKHPLITLRRTKSVNRGPSGALLSEKGAEISDPAAGESVDLHISDLNEYKRILFLLSNHSGIDFSMYRPNTIERRINRRMVLNKQSKLGDYARFLKSNPKEIALLYADLLICVTHFFRNPEAFEALQTKVFPGCWSGTGGRMIRCECGRSAVPRDKRPIPSRWHLLSFATEFRDRLGSSFLRLTLMSRCWRRLGRVYMPGTLSQMFRRGRLRRFFVEEQGAYRVSKSLRELCFSRGKTS